jgi:DAK2 domain fusion protein YloV
MTLPVVLGPAQLRAAMVAYRDALREHQQLLNRLNVYPVPDGDTGTNMALTLEAVVRELEGLGGVPAMGEVCRAIAHGSLMGARGNSGVILSQLLRGLTERLGTEEEVSSEVLADALVTAGELARKAVVRPVAGTILTVARAAGEGALAGCRSGAALVGMLDAARGAAARALAETPSLLEALARAQVVDAGGAGYVFLFDALLAVLDGRAVEAPAALSPAAASGSGATAPAAREEGPAGHDAAAPETTDLRYEVMYLLDAPDDTIEAFKDVWSGIGDSIVVVGGDGVWNCHVHTNDIGAAVEAAIDIGRPRQIRVTDLAEQVQEERWVRDAVREPSAQTGPAPPTSVVAVVAGEGVGRIFRSLGVHHLVTGGQSMNPSTEDLLRAVEATGSDQVVILPNNENVEPVARQVDGLSGKAVRVVPTGSIVEGFAALLAYDPDAGVDENAAAMAASAAHVVPGTVTRAVRDADTPAGHVRQGDWLGLVRGTVVAVAGSPDGAALQLLESALEPQHELVTVIEGEGATAAATRRITEWLHEERSGVEAEVHRGGQPLYAYLLGIE